MKKYILPFTLISTAFGQAGTEDSWFFGYGNRGGEHIVMEATPSALSGIRFQVSAKDIGNLARRR